MQYVERLTRVRTKIIATVGPATDDLDTMRMGAKCTLIFSVCSGLAAKGADEYFVIMTVQKGDPPEVMVKGTGLGAVVKIGERTARFDGKNVVFE